MLSLYSTTVLSRVCESIAVVGVDTSIINISAKEKGFKGKLEEIAFYTGHPSPFLTDTNPLTF